MVDLRVLQSIQVDAQEFLYPYIGRCTSSDGSHPFEESINLRSGEGVTKVFEGVHKINVDAITIVLNQGLGQTRDGKPGLGPTILLAHRSAIVDQEDGVVPPEDRQGVFGGREILRWMGGEGG